MIKARFGRRLARLLRHPTLPDKELPCCRYKNALMLPAAIVRPKATIVSSRRNRSRGFGFAFARSGLDPSKAPSVPSRLTLEGASSQMGAVPT